MKTKMYLYIALALLIVILLGSLLFKKKEVSTMAPAADQTSATTDTTDASGIIKKSTAATTSATVRMTGGRYGATTVLSIGQKLLITFSMPVDAGYQVDPIQSDSSVLALTSQTATTREFTAMKPGTTGLTISASQNGKNTVVLFENAVSVK